MDLTDIENIKNALSRQAKEIGFGTVMFYAKVHDGNVFNLDTQKFYTHKTPDGNKQALQIIAQLMKGMQESKQVGNLTFTIDFNKEGQSNKVVIQDAEKHRLL